uniref:Ribosomal protein S18 n=1 Tax=Timema genevievae TaxID=629358 RepID=A0A7R9K7Y7_TIMGE|nr:unnamed protein product [Timema genevievae]
MFRALKLISHKLHYLNTIQVSCRRNITFSKVNHLKEIRESHQGKVLTIEGVLVPSPREQYLVRTEHEGVCSLCSIGVDVKHTDVLILSQFLRADGCMLPRRITGLCKNQQKRISILVQMAQKAGI